MKRDRLRGVGSFLLLVLAAAGAAPGQVITEFPVPLALGRPSHIVTGPDGNLWCADSSSDAIYRMTTNGLATTFYTSNPGSITAGPDGNLWFSAEDVAATIGRITPAGVITYFPFSSSAVDGVVFGPDGNLWFVEPEGNRVGRMTVAGLVTEFPIPTIDSNPYSIIVGSDGNLWFTELQGNKIGRITTDGFITEFDIPTPMPVPYLITNGPDGNLWFTEAGSNKIGRLTTAGSITEFSVPTPDSSPFGIVTGPDGNIWFVESSGNQIGRLTTAGVFTEFAIPTSGSEAYDITQGPDGNLWFSELQGHNIGRVTGPITPQGMTVDAHSAEGTSSNSNGMLEAGESVLVAPAWKNVVTNPQAFTGAASNLTGPSGPTYVIDNSSANYGVAGAGVTKDCDSASGNCYRMTVSGARPAAHWDAAFTETLSTYTFPQRWTLHVGGSFSDVAASNPFYASIETLLHNAVTGGCDSANYCPAADVTRAEMSVFLLKSKFGASHAPPPGAGTVFADVHVGDFAADWIEELAGLQITGGCGNSNFCPDEPVTRAEMAVFLLKAEHGSAYAPPPCTGIFADVACSPTPAFAADWIEQLFHENITAGCDATHFCPDGANTRDQMAAFLVKTFGLKLYGP